MSVVFISYRRDSALVHARAVYERLSKELGPGQVFIDLDDMEPGVDFVEQTNTQLRGCHVLLALIDPDWANASDHKGQRRLDRANDFVRIEIATALRRGIRVVPILIGDADMPDADALPDDLKALARRHALPLDFRRFDAEIARLVTAIRRILANPAQDTKTAVEAAAGPTAAAFDTQPAAEAAPVAPVGSKAPAAPVVPVAPVSTEAPAVRQPPATARATAQPATAPPAVVKEPVATPPPPAAIPAPAPRPQPTSTPQPAPQPQPKQAPDSATSTPPAATPATPATTAAYPAKRIPWPQAAGVAAGIAVIGYLMLRPAPSPAPEATSPAAPAATTSAQAQPTAQQSLSAGQTFRDCTNCPEMVVIPAGSFLMGSPASEPGRSDREGPQRRVTLGSFALGKTEVTQAQWEAVMGNNPSGFANCGDDCPVETVSWDDAQQFIQRLNAKTGKSYRLPSEAEWEYAARAGTTTPFHTGKTISTAQANYDGNSVYGNGVKGEYRQATIKAASFAPNAFGLYDMHGNVWEWVQDCYDDKAYGGKAPNDGRAYELAGCSSRALRGGAWGSDAAGARSASRGRYPPGNRNSVIGLRLARMLP